jgi:hypothetical protein
LVRPRPGLSTGAIVSSTASFTMHSELTGDRGRAARPQPKRDLPDVAE